MKVTDQQLRDLRQRLTEAAADAARDTPGVAVLRSDLVTVLRAGSRLAGREGSTQGMPSVHVHRATGGSGWEVEVDVRLAVHRGNRALDVSRAVRSAVESAVRAALPSDGSEPSDGHGSEGHGGASGGRVRVSVTVTGLM
ncbi:Asp23/Gls24 family envelope stress response protein [Streptomyces sparsus]